MQTIKKVIKQCTKYQRLDIFHDFKHKATATTTTNTQSQCTWYREQMKCYSGHSRGWCTSCSWRLLFFSYSNNFLFLGNLHVPLSHFKDNLRIRGLYSLLENCKSIYQPESIMLVESKNLQYIQLNITTSNFNSTQRQGATTPVPPTYTNSLHPESETHRTAARETKRQDKCLQALGCRILFTFDWRRFFFLNHFGRNLFLWNWFLWLFWHLKDSR